MGHADPPGLYAVGSPPGLFRLGDDMVKEEFDGPGHFRFGALRAEFAGPVLERGGGDSEVEPEAVGHGFCGGAPLVILLPMRPPFPRRGRLPAINFEANITKNYEKVGAVLIFS